MDERAGRQITHPVRRVGIRQVMILLLVAIGLLAARASSGDIIEQLPPCSGELWRQFDFWVGDWNVLDASGRKIGTNRIQKILEGCGLAEHWRGAGGTNGESLSYFHFPSRRWRQLWLDNKGIPIELEGQFVNGEMVLEGESSSHRNAEMKALNRITWRKLESGRVQQTWDASDDGGKTWKTVFSGTYVRKKPH